MKRFLTLAVALIFAFCGMFSALCAETQIKVTEPYEASFTFPDGYTPITADTVDDNAELLKFLGLTEEEMTKYFTEKNFLAFSISSDYREQIYVLAEQNDVSSAIVNLSDINDPASVQDLLVGDIESEGATVSLTEPIDENVYFYVVKETAVKEEASSDAASSDTSSAPTAENPENEVEQKTEPCMVYYTTVVDSVAYVICYSGESGSFSPEARLMMSGFVNSMTLGRGPSEPQPELENKVQIVVNWVLIALAGGIIVYAAVTLVAEFRKRRLEEDFHEKSPKRPLR